MKALALLLLLAAPPYHDRVETGRREIILTQTTGEPVGGFFKAGSDEPAAAQSLVWMRVADDALHVAVACADRDVSARPAEHNADTIWQDDCFELFLDPARNGERQYHLIFNATGSRYDEVIGGGRIGRWTATAQTIDDGWRGKAVIPFASLGIEGTPPRGTVWFVKLTRSDVGRDATGGSSWTRIGKTFDDTSAFADLVFESRNLIDPAAATPVSSGDATGECRAVDGGYDLTWTGTSYNLRFAPEGNVVPQSATTYLFAARVRQLTRHGNATLRFMGAHGRVDPQTGWMQIEIPVTVAAGRRIEGADLHLAHGNQSRVEIRDVSLRIDDRLSMAEGVMCLTGNAPRGLTERNQRVPGGRYTWREAWSDADRFPPFVNWPDRGAPERGYRTGGWIDFTDGLLTDGDLQTRAGFPIYSTAINGHDIVIDLGRDYTITAVHVASPRPVLRRVALYAKADGDERYVHVADTFDVARQQRGGFPRRSAIEVDDLNMTARWLRVNVSVSHDKYVGPAEVRVWGYEGGPSRAIEPYKTEVRIAKPQAAELPEAPKRMVFPLPREVEWGEGALRIDENATVAGPGGLLIEQVRDLTGITLREGDGAITLQPGDGEAYRVEITSGGATLSGNIPWATQTLLWLIEHDGDGYRVPAVTIVDEPRVPIRLVQGSRQLSRGLIAALARFKVNHYVHTDFPHIEPIDPALSTYAQTLGVQIIPFASPRFAIHDDPQRFVERGADEALADLGSGRWNPNVGKETFWQHYFAKLDAAIRTYNGEYVLLGLDEMHQPRNGSRWNVSPESRAKNMAGHELLAWTINRTHRYLKEKFDKRAMIVDSPFAHRGISHADDDANDWRLLPGLLDRDIAVYCLDYNAAKTRDMVAGRGMDVLYWCINPTIGEHFPSVYDGMFLNLADGPFHLANIAALAQVCWSPDRMDPSQPAYWAYAEAALPEFRRLYTGQIAPSAARGAKLWSPIDLGDVANITRVDDRAGDGEGWLDLGPALDLRALAAGRHAFGGVPFDVADGAVMVHNRGRVNRTLPQRVAIEVDGRADSLVFLHALSRKPGQTYHRKAELAGQYYIEYADGTFATYDIKYNINAANWLGLGTDWDYAPKGTALKAGRHVWRGQTGSGATADLYTAEWINPRPSVPLQRVILASPQMKTVADPILLGLTAVRLKGEPRDRDDVQWMDARPVPRMKRDDPPGDPIDLSGGVLKDFGVYVAPDGTRITAPGMGSKADEPTRAPGTMGCENFFATAAQVVHDNNEWVSRAVTVTFPEPRALSGAGAIGAYRFEIYNNDFPPSVGELHIAVSQDGETFRNMRIIERYNPETEGLRIAPLDPGDPVKAVRFSGMDITYVALFD